MSALPTPRAQHPLHSPADIAPPDWATARILWEQGLTPQREIAHRIGVGLKTLQDKAKRHGWHRDIASPVKARAESILSLPAGTARVLAAVAGPGALAPEDERAAIDMGAQAIVQVRLGHRRDIQRARRVVSSLMDELEVVQDSPEIFQQVRDWLESLDPLSTVPLPLLHSALQVVESLPQRAKVAKDLVETLRSVVGMEREAFGLDSMDGTRPVVIVKDYTGKGSPESPPQEPEPLEVGEDGAYGLAGRGGPIQAQGEASAADAEPPAPAPKRPSSSTERMRALRERKRAAAAGHTG